ncbi:MAG: TonB-dependent receptor, partial [Candidatus Firestonebacteria bacterium]|nr:TonB-dependent receptor [Candidatus Firestonebacteria bacterium]
MKFMRLRIQVPAIGLLWMVSSGFSVAQADIPVSPVALTPTAQTAPAGVTAPAQTLPASPAPVAAAVLDPKPLSEHGNELLLFEELKVTVASQSAESLKEAPVVTSVVTAEQIRRMGARTLDDVLQTIPGFSHIQDHNENFSAEHGIYGSSQQKILVLRDGHRLNSRSYSEANFDYALSLENVDHIEIMRGPGGSVYGDVALTAVINLVTFNPEEFSGVEAKIGAGNFGQKKAAVVAGYDLKALGAFLASGTFFQSDGQVINSADAPDPRHPADQGGVWMNGFNTKPSYDLYLKYNWRDFALKASKRYSHMLEQRTSGGATGQVYENLQGFAEMNGETPGLSSGFDHYELAYAPNLGGYTWTNRLYWDMAQIDVNIVSNSATRAQSLVQWNEWAGGLQSQVSKSYACLGQGDLLAGIQAETTEVYKSILASGVNPSLDNPAAVPALATGKERSYAAFAQAKHKFLDSLILNAGVRYDYKVRRLDPNGVLSIADAAQVSPRAALMYLLNEDFNFRLSYGHCFVDAPYWYRYNNLPGYSGAMTLKPESLNSYQLTVGENLWKNAWTHQVNFFANDYQDVVYRNPAAVYSNAGAVKANGAEYEMAFKRENLDARCNYTFQNFTEASGLVERWGMMENIPEHMGNLIVDVAPAGYFLDRPWAKALWLNLGLRYIGRQFARWDKTAVDPRDSVDAAVVVNCGITAGELAPGLTLGIHANNLLDQKYYQGGSVQYPY